MPDANTPPVTWAEFRQKLRWSKLFGLLWIGIWYLALHQLRSVGISFGMRLLWCAVPLPLMALGFWLMFQEAKNQKEMERRVSAEAVGYAFPLSIVFYAGMGLVHVAFPIAAETWAMAWIIPLLIYMWCWMLVYRRYNPR